MMRDVPESEIKGRLGFDNPWWTEGAVEGRFRDMPRRAYYGHFCRLVAESEVRRAVILMGPRRVGKTVMIYQAVQGLLDAGVAPGDILYVSVDTPVYTGLSLEALLGQFRAVQGHGPRDAAYVFFDEIQYLAEWERQLKSLVDSYPDVRFVASGSAAAALRLKGRESGAGRFTDFALPPLSFPEFLRFRGLEDDLVDTDGTAMDVPALNAAFIDYLNFGGFPEVVMLAEVRERMDRYVADDIVEKVLLRDLPGLYGIDDPRDLYRLFNVLAYNTGQEVNLEGLAASSQIAKNTLRRYLEFLESAFLIRRVYRVDQSGRRFRRQTHFKVYLTNPCLRAALFGPVGADDAAMGSMAETAVVSQMAHSHEFVHLCYARWPAGEVDFVWLSPRTQKPWLVLEVKWSDRAVRDPDRTLGALTTFCQNAGTVGDCWVSTRNEEARQFLSGFEIRFGPTAEICWSLGSILVDDELAEGRHPLGDALAGGRLP